MDHIAFHTSTVKTGSGSSETGNVTALSSSGKGVMALGSGMSFFDLMFARLASSEKSKTTSVKAESSQQNNFEVTKLPGGNLGVNLTGSGKNNEPASKLLDQQLKVKGIENDILSNISNKKKFLEWLNSLVAGLPEGEKPVIDMSGKLTKKDLLGSAGNLKFPGLIAAGITPEQLNAAMEKFGRDVLQQYEGDEDIQGVIVGIVKMIPPESKAPFDAIVMPKALFISNGAQNDTMAGQAAMPTPPPNGQTAPAGPLSIGQKPSSYTPMAPLAPETSEGQSLSEAMALAKATANSGNQKAGSGNSEANGTVIQNNNANSSMNPGTQIINLLDFPFAGDLVGFRELGSSDPLMEQLGLNPPGQNITHSANLTQTLTQAQHASSSHPATQIVAAHLQKAAGKGETRNVTLQLEPPDLGKVEVRMQFSAKDKSVKAHMLVEKHETYLMLQRDAHVLERALQDAGLDVNGESLDFELAQDGHEFSHDGSHDGSSGRHSGNSENEPGEMEAIEASMNWYIDPETGSQRYDLLV
jgi:hypothetical protein